MGHYSGINHHGDLRHFGYLRKNHDRRPHGIRRSTIPSRNLRLLAAVLPAADELAPLSPTPTRTRRRRKSTARHVDPGFWQKFTDHMAHMRWTARVDE